MWDVAYGQTGERMTPGVFTSLIPLVLVFLVFYFLLIRPQQKKAKEHKEMLASLKKNDEVITSGGIYGRVIALNEKIVTLEVADKVRIRVERPQIAAMVKGAKGAAPSAREEKEP